MKGGVTRVDLSTLDRESRTTTEKLIAGCGYVLFFVSTN